MLFDPLNPAGIVTPATRELESRGLPFRIFVHSTPPTSLEQAAQERGQVSVQIVRSILFRQDTDSYIMVLMAGAGQISWQKVRKFLRVSRITMASRDEVLAVTGYPVGAVSPLGLQVKVRILADRNVNQPGEISLGSGTPGVAIILQSSDLFKAVDMVEIGDFSQ